VYKRQAIMRTKDGGVYCNEARGIIGIYHSFRSACRI